MELVQGMKNKAELQAFLRQMRHWSVSTLQLDRDISSRAMFYVEEFFLSHRMELADALIGATAVHCNETLLTANDRHYRHLPNIQLEKFFP
jgi:predicted nucleic acid-binding protein